MLDPRRYKPEDFHDDGTLKVSWLLWLILIFLSRHLLVLALGGISTFSGSRSGVDTTGLSTLYSSPALLLASAPAVLVIVARFRRVSSAGPLVRQLWRRGSQALVLAATLDLVLTAWLCAEGRMAVNELLIGAGILDVYILVYVHRSVRLRDIFQDFPEAPARQTGSNRRV